MAGGVVAAGDVPGNVVCDLDGVLYLGNEGIPGAGEALAELDRRGYRLVFATNNSTRTPQAVADKVTAATGYRARIDQVVTSAQSAAALLAAERPPALIVGGEGVRAALEAVGIEVVAEWRRAAAVVVGLDTGLTYERLAGAVQAVRAGARFVATNDDVTLPTPEGLLPGAGSIVAAVAAATGIAPLVTGKPHQPMRELIKARLGPGPTRVIGDRDDTDLAMGRAEGWETILVLTGVSRPAYLADAPDLVLGGIGDLPGVLP